MLKASKGSVMTMVFIFFAVCSSLACVYFNKKNQPQHHVFLLSYLLLLEVQTTKDIKSTLS